MAAAIVRPATLDDIEELVRLRALMVESMGLDASGEEWRAALRVELRQRILAEAQWCPDLWGGPASVILVVDRPGGLASNGVGWLTRHLPGPTNLTGHVGHIANMSTDPGWRRRGLARLIFADLLAWFDRRGTAKVELNATAMGEALYRSFGFAGPRATALVRTVGR